ncbi:MAG TPA: RNA polymerase sigma factor [Methylomirabilota bacterium]|nr:RNA polymerase sigma factor [Methylomirabilota bacterium]
MTRVETVNAMVERGNGQRHDRDGALLAALRGGAPDAAERLLATYGDRVYRLAMSITGSAPDAEEVVQDALWSVIRRIETFRGDSALGSWIYRVVANAAYQKIRSRVSRRAEIPLEDVLPSFHETGHAESMGDWSAQLDDPSRTTELRLVLTAAIDELPADYRAALVLRDADGLSNEEVARVLGVTVGAVKSRAHRARLFVRQRLEAAMAVPADH